jgi:opacity protein-like surface antigen
MFKLNKIAGSVIAVTAILGSAGVALADGYAPKGKKVVYERPTNWSGFYFGVGSGYQWSNTDIGLAAVPGLTIAEVDQNSAFVTAFGGVQHQFGVVVVGVEGGWKSTFREDGSTPCIVPGALACKARLNDILTVGGRLGWAAGHWMPYVTGGYATARFEQELRDVPADNLLLFAGTRHNGWYIGGGFEWQVSPGWTAGLEYRHYDFGDATGPIVVAGAPPVPLGLDVRNDATTDTLTARVSWRWGRPEPKPLK